MIASPFATIRWRWNWYNPCHGCARCIGNKKVFVPTLSKSANKVTNSSRSLTPLEGDFAEKTENLTSVHCTIAGLIIKTLDSYIYILKGHPRRSLITSSPGGINPTWWGRETVVVDIAESIPLKTGCYDPRIFPGPVGRCRFSVYIEINHFKESWIIKMGIVDVQSLLRASRTPSAIEDPLRVNRQKVCPEFTLADNSFRYSCQPDYGLALRELFPMDSVLCRNG